MPAQSLDLDDTKTITMEELAEGLRKQGSPIAQKELEARARPDSQCRACFLPSIDQGYAKFELACRSAP